MKHTTLSLVLLVSLFGCVVFAGTASAQGFNDPLTIQGIDHSTNPSVSSLSMGGIIIGMKNDVGILFLNPAELQTLDKAQLMIGGMNYSVESGQVQQYAPLKYYSNFSLLMEGLTGNIPAPVYDTSNHNYNAGDTVQRPFDSIGPDWSHFKSHNVPLQAVGAFPFKIGSVGIVLGLGTEEYANLNHYYQNNNVLDPAIGSERPIPYELTDTTIVQWSQFLRWREGSIRKFGAALSVALTERLAIGISGGALAGSTNDFQQQIARGRLSFIPRNSAYYFSLDSVYNRTQWSGTSDYSGADFTISGVYHGKLVTIGAAVKPPVTITRKYTTMMDVDTTGVPVRSILTGEDKIKLPWQGTVGLAFSVRPNVMIGLEYEIRSYESAVYTGADGSTSNPWLSASVYHAGLQYIPTEWLSLRAGVRGQTEIFQPAGSPIDGEPAGYSIYSVGAGLSCAGARLDLAYEYGRMNYDETWQTNVNLNSETHRSIAASLSYTIPWE